MKLKGKSKRERSKFTHTLSCEHVTIHEIMCFIVFDDKNYVSIQGVGVNKGLHIQTTLTNTEQQN